MTDKQANNEAEHTPGPWAAIRDYDGDHAIYSGNELVAVTDGWAAGNRSKRTMEDDFANARLIAAAPDMLAALERIAEWRFDIQGDCVADAQKVARTAIAKALGESEKAGTE